MDTIMEIASRHDLLVIEDAAQAVQAFYKRAPFGQYWAPGCGEFIKAMQDLEVACLFHYVALHDSPKRGDPRVS